MEPGLTRDPDLGEISTIATALAKTADQLPAAVGDIIRKSIPPSMSVTVPTLGASALIGIVIALTSAYFRGRFVDPADAVAVIEPFWPILVAGNDHITRRPSAVGGLMLVT